MKEIQLTQGKVALVDNEDYDFLMQWKWCVKNMQGRFYACRGCVLNKKKICIYMHRLITNNNNPKMHTDHVNNNSLDTCTLLHLLAETLLIVLAFGLPFLPSQGCIA